MGVYLYSMRFYLYVLQISSDAFFQKAFCLYVLRTSFRASFFRGRTATIATRVKIIAIWSKRIIFLNRFYLVTIKQLGNDTILQYFNDKSVFTIFVNSLFNKSATPARKMVFDSCFIRIVAGLTDIRFVVVRVCGFVDTTHNMSSPDLCEGSHHDEDRMTFAA